MSRKVVMLEVLIDDEDAGTAEAIACEALRVGIEAIKDHRVALFQSVGVRTPA